ncbi:MAG TPA: phosphoribosylglycinamide formyltransferase [Candidatus Anaerotruncus excrementipullorum]|uniref:Phosphoribosylglycinamide formyltransferase n=1 Tax=Candidatus Anaerotruncus excrementipullorum TaxID=2838465 RepID=A0A9D1WQ42_9FIRM|nr:phosphoribosylglycinamide formyltransferase [Candidatus Anaerotruncus excrementipullorum]
MKRIAVLVSGGGTNLQALIDAQADGRLKSGRIVRVISSKPDAYALTRADRAGIPTTVVPRKQYASRQAYDEAVLAALEEAQADLVILAGFLYVLGPRVIRAYPDRIINVHPALIPSFCGDGFYGLKVHEAALAYGVKVTGATVHLVNEVTDGGRILLQKAVEVQEGDTPETLQRRVMEQAEWVLLPQAAEMLCKKLQEEQDG